MGIFRLLLKMRILTLRNVLKDTLRRNPVAGFALMALGATVFVGVTIGFCAFFRIAGFAGVLDDTIYQTFYMMFLFLLASALPFVASTLLLSADYALLFSAPVSSTSVIAAKLLDATVSNSLQFGALGVPAMLACAIVVHLPFVGWLLLPFLICLFAFLPALIVALALLFVLKFAGARRLRRAIALVNVLMAAFVCLTFVREAERMPLQAIHFDASTAALPAMIKVRSGTSRLAPSSAFADAILGESAFQSHDFRSAIHGWLTIAGWVSGLFIMCLAIGGNVLTAGRIAEESEVETLLPMRTPAWNRLRLVVPAGVLSIVVKDLKYFHRDKVLLSQISMPLILYAIPLLAGLQSQHGDSGELVAFSGIMVGIILFMHTSILSLTSIGLEGRAFWILLASPNRAVSILTAKLMETTLISAGVAVVLTLISTVIYDVPIVFAAAEIGVFGICACGLCGLGVGISAIFPRFVYDNPAHRVSAWALVSGFFASMGYLIILGLICGLAWFTVASPWAFLHVAPVLVCIVVVILATAFTLCTVWSILHLGVRRLTQYEWEH